MQRVDISYKTIIFTVLFLISVYILYLLRNVILLLFISFIIMSAFNPLVSWTQKFKIPRALGILIFFIITGIIIGLIFASIIPAFIEQSTTLAKNLTITLPDSSVFEFDPSMITSQFELISKNAVNVVKLAVSAASNILTIFTVLVFNFYLLMERQNLPKYFKAYFGRGNGAEKAEELLDSIEKKLGGWVRGEIALMIIVGLLSYIGLTLLNIPYALPLALLAGLLELIPNIGPTISAIPAIIVGFTVSPAIALGVLALYLAVQQLENNIIVPMVMRQSVGINPIVTMLCLMVGFTLGGVPGMILGVPIYITSELVVQHIFKYRSDN